jgi:lipoprotein-anchoring transpeptidase ErfK/SrfK
MHKKAYSAWFQRAGMVLVGVSLTVTNLGFSLVPARAQPESTTVATKAPVNATDPMSQAIEKLRQSDKRWLEVNTTKQRLIAWEGRQPVRAVIISSGKSSTPTRLGVFAVQSKYRVARMQGDDYDVPDVPFTMYYSGGYAIHGAYWHNRFGTPVSHGCVNVAVDHAEWFFKWASVGTPVVVHD